MATYFISDLHLSPDTHDLNNLFDHFCSWVVTQAPSAVYILGDFFDAWIGDDFKSPFTEHIAQQLRDIARHCDVFFIHGNRDFLLGESFAQTSCITLLEETATIKAEGLDALIMHGDTLCTDDHDYMRFRQQVRNPQWQQQILALSISERLQKAQALRNASHDSMNQKAEQIMDVNDGAVKDVMITTQSNLLIHGHTHRPNLHQVKMDNRLGHRIVLSDWSKEQGNFLKLESNAASLCYFNLAGILHEAHRLALN